MAEADSLIKKSDNESNSTSADRSENSHMIQNVANPSNDNLKHDLEKDSLQRQIDESLGDVFPNSSNQEEQQGEETFAENDDVFVASEVGEKNLNSHGGQSRSGEIEEKLLEFDEDDNCCIPNKSEPHVQHVRPSSKDTPIQATSPKIAWPEIQISSSLNSTANNEAVTGAQSIPSECAEATRTFRHSDVGENQDEPKHQVNDVSSFRSAFHSAPTQPESDLPMEDSSAQNNSVRLEAPSSAPVISCSNKDFMWDIGSSTIAQPYRSNGRDVENLDPSRPTPENAEATSTTLEPAIAALIPVIPSAPTIAEVASERCDAQTQTDLENINEAEKESPDTSTSLQPHSEEVDRDPVTTNILMKFTSDIKLSQLLCDAYRLLSFKDEKLTSDRAFIKKYEDEEKCLRHDLRTLYQSVRKLIDGIWERKKELIMLEAFKKSQKIDSKSAANLLIQACSVLTDVKLEDNKLDRLLCDFISSADDVVELGKYFAREKKLNHALYSYYAAAKLYDRLNQAEMSIPGIETCIKLSCDAINREYKKIKKGHFYCHFIPMMCEMLNNLKETSSIDVMLKMSSIALCSSYIGQTYFVFDAFEKCLQINQSAVDLLRSNLNEKVDLLQNFGRCLEDIGKVYQRTGKAEKAMEMYELTLASYDKACDWKTDTEKNEAISDVATKHDRIKQLRH